MSDLNLLPGNQAAYSFDVIQPMADSPLAEKNLCVLGSSVVYGYASNQCAVGEYLAARLGMHLTKEAVSGTTLAVQSDKHASYIERMMLNLDPQAHFDLFICQLSTNDATQGLPLGQIADSTTLADFDTSTITGAMEYIIAYAHQTWQCPVAFFTGSHYDSTAYHAMVKQLMALQQKWGIGIMNLWQDLAFNTLTDEQRALYMADPIHPTRAGYRDWWGPEMEKQLLVWLHDEELMK